MRDYKIRVMAISNFNGKTSQVEKEMIEIQTDDLDRIDIGRVSDFYVIEPNARIEVWIESNPTALATE